jgi:hypothetical protein
MIIVRRAMGVDEEGCAGETNQGRAGADLERTARIA